MNKLHDVKLTVTTAANGSGSATSTRPVFGRLEMVDWIDGTFSNGVGGTLTVTLTPSGTDRTLLTLAAADNDALYYPRIIANGSTGGTLSGVYERMVIDGYLKLTIDSGGSVTTGGAIVYYTVD